MTTPTQALEILEDIDASEPRSDAALMSLALHDDPDNRTLACALHDALLERGLCPAACGVIVSTARRVGADARDITRAGDILGDGSELAAAVRAAVVRRHPLALPETPIDLVPGSRASRLFDPDPLTGQVMRYYPTGYTPSRARGRRYARWRSRLRISIGARRVVELASVVGRELGG